MDGPALEVWILAGGLGTRMQKDKARVRIGGRTMLGHVRQAATLAGYPVRVVRRDAVPRCGPLGGIITALRKTPARAVVFLACDMPFVSGRSIERVVRASGGVSAAFASVQGRCGFPFVLPRGALAVVERQRATGNYSLGMLAVALGARRVRFGRASVELFNVNTQADLDRARRLMNKRRGGA